jgi:hypothetical protein
VAGLFVSVVAIAADNEPTITVRLYNAAVVPASELKRATAEASWLFSTCGVNVRWIQCERAPRPASGDLCDARDDPFNFTILIRADEPRFVSVGALGFSLPLSGGRNHGAVLYPRISSAARLHRAFVVRSQVMGFAIAHEVAHLILGSPAHAARGIMRNYWRVTDFQAMGQRQLRFMKPEAAEMRRALSVHEKTAVASID